MIKTQRQQKRARKQRIAKREIGLKELNTRRDKEIKAKKRLSYLKGLEKK